MPSDHGRRPAGPPERSRPLQETARDRQESPHDREDMAAVLSGDATRIDDVAERLAMRLVQGLNRSQIRNFYGPLRSFAPRVTPKSARKPCACIAHASPISLLALAAARRNCGTFSASF
jgi:hypothetical protein